MTTSPEFIATLVENQRYHHGINNDISNKTTANDTRV